MSDKYRTITFEGLDELQRGFEKLAAYAERDVIKNACKNAAQVVADEAKSLAPVKTGQLKKAIRVRMGRSRQGTVSALATVGKKWFEGDAFYGAFQEFGWKIGKRDGGFSRFITRRAALIWKEWKSQGLAKKDPELRARQRNLTVAQAFHDYHTGKIKYQGRTQIPGEHFMQFAFDEKADAALQVMLAAMKDGIEEELRSAAK